MGEERRDLTERILRLSLRIIYLLTGEDYGPVKKKSAGPRVSGGWRRSQSPNMESPHASLTPERNHEKKILEITNKIIELLTGEVPIRCEDVAVYLSMEEREYLEGHSDLYKAAMMEEEPITSPDDNSEPPETEPRPLHSQHSTQEEHRTSDLDQQQQQVMAKVYMGVMEERPDAQIKVEEITQQSSTDVSVKKNSMEMFTFISEDGDYITEDFPREDPTVLNHSPANPSFSITRQAEWFADHFPPGPPHILHRAPEMPLCSEGVKYFAQKAELPSLESHKVQDLLSYPESGSYFSLIQREQVTHNMEMFSCSECGKYFAHKADFLRHKSFHTRVKTFSCPKCGKSFSQRGHLLSHERIHMARRPFSCSICGKCYTQKSSLNTHEKVHFGLKPYICSDCGKCFSRKSLLTLHKRVHTGEKPYSCSECGRCFSQRAHLVSHRRTHMAEKPFCCAECGKCYSRKSYLDDHCRTHSGVKPYPCPICGKCFSDKTSFRSHQRIHRDKDLF